MKMYVLELALLGTLIYNEFQNEYLRSYLVCFGISSCASYVMHNKFTISNQIRYCNFADKRCICGIPNFGDVISNVIFILAGFYHLLNTSYNINTYPYFGFLCIGIGIGSTYFHWKPNIRTLYWDRLPMIFGMAFIINHYSGLNLEHILLHGLFALDYHSLTNDLSIYVAFQLNMMLFLLWIRGFSWPVVLYALAKYFEDNDKKYYLQTGFISGHTIKHILAGIAMFLL